jgi:hypothetical protein
MTASFVETIILAVVSLSVTFVLFRWLESRAQGTSEVMGTTIKYGGALAGFVLVFSLTSYVYSRLAAEDGRTEIDLAGDYVVELYEHGGGRFDGTATIRQRPGTNRVDLAGEVVSTETPPSVTFHTIEGVIRDRRIIWLYENDMREMGLALGTLPADRPDHFVLTYTDLMGSDLNHDPDGRLVFRRKP